MKRGGPTIPSVREPPFAGTSTETALFTPTKSAIALAPRIIERM